MGPGLIMKQFRYHEAFSSLEDRAVDGKGCSTPQVRINAGGLRTKQADGILGAAGNCFLKKTHTRVEPKQAHREAEM